VIADADVAAAAALIGDPTRAAFLLTLGEDEPLPASELARRAGVPASTASGQLAKLVEGGLVKVDRDGRHRYFRLADASVAQAVEALAVIAPPRPVRSLRDAETGAALQLARTCYDHLAGRLGVALADALQSRGYVRFENGTGLITESGQRFLGAFGLDLAPQADLKSNGRALCRACLDGTERRPHLAGCLGAALCAHCFDLGWIERKDGSRAVAITRAGQSGLARTFGLPGMPPVT
jgi:DNA-binding transcriptional ArsR family regulator